MFSINEVVAIIISSVAIIISIFTFIIQKLTYQKKYLEENLFDVDCKGILFSNVATLDDAETDADKANDFDNENTREGIKRYHDGSFSVHVKDAMIIEFVFVFTTSGRCFLMDSDIKEIRLENSFKKIKITGLTSLAVVKKVNGFASHGFTLKTTKECGSRCKGVNH